VDQTIKEIAQQVPSLIVLAWIVWLFVGRMRESDDVLREVSDGMHTLTLLTLQRLKDEGHNVQSLEEVIDHNRDQMNKRRERHHKERFD